MSKIYEYAIKDENGLYAQFEHPFGLFKGWGFKKTTTTSPDELLKASKDCKSGDVEVIEIKAEDIYL